MNSGTSLESKPSIILIVIVGTPQNFGAHIGMAAGVGAFVARGSNTISNASGTGRDGTYPPIQKPTTKLDFRFW